MLQPKLGLPSLAICSNAARSVSTIMENQITRYGYWHQPQSPLLLVNSLVLLVDLWQKMTDSGREANHPAYREHWKDINQCMNNLERIEGIWYHGGKFLYVHWRICKSVVNSRYRDIVRDLAKVSPNCHSLMHQEKASSNNNMFQSGSNPDILHGHDVLGYPIYAPSPSHAHASGPSISCGNDGATALGESLLQHQYETGDHRELLESIGMAQLPVEVGSWMDCTAPDLGDPAFALFSMQPYFSLPIDPNAWFDQAPA